MLISYPSVNNIVPAIKPSPPLLPGPTRIRILDLILWVSIIILHF